MNDAAPLLDLRPDHWDIVRDLLQRHVPDREVLAFGSRATWKAKQYSDLDLAILGDKPLSLDASAALAEAFSESDLPFKVDLVDWARIDGSFRKIIRRDGLTLQNPRAKTRATDTARQSSNRMSKWRVIEIKDIARKIAMGPFGSNIKVETFVPDGIPIISGKHLRGTRLNDSLGFNFITQEHAQRLANANVYRGDIVFTHAGNIGQVAYVPADSKFARYVISQRQFYLRVDTSKADPAFIARWFHGPLGKHRLLVHASQVGVPAISRPVTNLKRMQIELPPLWEQKAITKIFDSIDDKIELNWRMNATLEAMARVIFKDWFVDFGPTRAKAEGHPPYLAPEVWSLFPDALDDEGKPVGWQTYLLSDLTHHHRATLSPGVQPERTYEHYSIPAYDAGHEPVADLGRAIKSNKTIVPEGAVLLSKLNPEIERVWLPNPIGNNPQIASTEFLSFTPLPPATQMVLYCLFRSRYFRREMAARVTGTSKSHQRVQTKSLLSREVLAASPTQLALFDRMFSPMMSQLLSNRRESRKLSKIRDLLLPKLMSGEIRVAEGGAAVGAVE